MPLNKAKIAEKARAEIFRILDVPTNEEDNLVLLAKYCQYLENNLNKQATPETLHLLALELSTTESNEPLFFQTLYVKGRILLSNSYVIPMMSIYCPSI